MNANDAKLMRVYTALTDSTVEDSAPNVPDPGEPHDTDFDLFVEAAAGSVIGNSSAPYTLTTTLVNVTKQKVVGAPFSTVENQAFNAGSGWQTSGDDFVLTHRKTFPLPPASANSINDLYRFYVSMVTPGLRVVSFAGSRLFILV